MNTSKRYGTEFEKENDRLRSIVIPPDSKDKAIKEDALRHLITRAIRRNINSHGFDS